MFLVVLGLYSDWRLLLAWLTMIAVMGVVIPLQLPFLAAALDIGHIQPG